MSSQKVDFYVNERNQAIPAEMVIWELPGYLTDREIADEYDKNKQNYIPPGMMIFEIPTSFDSPTSVHRTDSSRSVRKRSLAEKTPFTAQTNSSVLPLWVAPLLVGVISLSIVEIASRTAQLTSASNFEAVRQSYVASNMAGDPKSSVMPLFDRATPKVV